MYIDGANPLRPLVATECSPFFANGRLCTAALMVRRSRACYGPKGGQSEGNESQDEHSWARGCAVVGERY
jgi:hypothetical protein